MRRVILIAVICLAAGGFAFAGYTLGRDSGADVAGARQEGQAAGERRGTRAGESAGYEAGYAEGRREGYRETYRSVYRRAFSEAFEQLGVSDGSFESSD